MDEVCKRINDLMYVRKYTDGNHVKLDGQMVFDARCFLTPTTSEGITPEIELHGVNYYAGRLPSSCTRCLGWWW